MLVFYIKIAFSASLISFCRSSINCSKLDSSYDIPLGRCFALGLNIIVCINGKHLRPIWHCLIFFLALCHLKLTGLTTQTHKIKDRTNHFKSIEVSVKTKHIIIKPDLQGLDISICSRHLKDSHRHFFISAIR